MTEIKVGDKVKAGADLFVDGFSIEEGEVGYVARIVPHLPNVTHPDLEILFPGKGSAVLVDGEYKVRRKRRNRLVKAKNLRIGDLLTLDGDTDPSRVVSIAQDGVHARKPHSIIVTTIGPVQGQETVNLFANAVLDVER